MKCKLECVEIIIATTFNFSACFNTVPLLFYFFLFLFSARKDQFAVPFVSLQVFMLIWVSEGQIRAFSTVCCSDRAFCVVAESLKIANIFFFNFCSM